jgi:hypothetical protein
VTPKSSLLPVREHVDPVPSRAHQPAGAWRGRLTKSPLAFLFPRRESCGGGRYPLKLDQHLLDIIPAIVPMAVGYVRVAALSQDPRSGLDIQPAAIRAFADAAGIELIRVFEDTGESAHNTSRPGLLALLAAVAGAHVTIIIVPDLTRLARNAADLKRFVDLFARLGVSVVSTTEPSDV